MLFEEASLRPLKVLRTRVCPWRTSIVLMHTRISSSARIKLDEKVASSLGLNGWRWYTYLK